jgi:hypothetical protein
VAEGADGDLDIALCNAVEKLEGKILKLRARLRDTRRDIKSVRSSKENWEEKEETPAITAKAAPALNGTHRKPKVFRVDYNEEKPMTLEEAMIEMEQATDYVVYRDSSKNCVSVLVRRSDGNYDLIES